LHRKLKKWICESPPHPCFVGFNQWSRIEADVKNLKRQLQMGIPDTICGYCGGDGCKVCSMRGWLNKWYRSHVVPEELQ